MKVSGFQGFRVSGGFQEGFRGFQGGFRVSGGFQEGCRRVLGGSHAKPETCIIESLQPPMNPKTLNPSNLLSSLTATQTTLLSSGYIAHAGEAGQGNGGLAGAEKHPIAPGFAV